MTTLSDLDGRDIFISDVILDLEFQSKGEDFERVVSRQVGEWMIRATVVTDLGSRKGWWEAKGFVGARLLVKQDQPNLKSAVASVLESLRETHPGGYASLLGDDGDDGAGESLRTSIGMFEARPTAYGRLWMKDVELRNCRMSIREYEGCRWELVIDGVLERNFLGREKVPTFRGNTLDRVISKFREWIEYHYEMGRTAKRLAEDIKGKSGILRSWHDRL